MHKHRLFFLICLVMSCVRSENDKPIEDNSARGLYMQIYQAFCLKVIECESFLGKGYSNIDACIRVYRNQLDCDILSTFNINNAAYQQLDNKVDAQACINATKALTCQKILGSDNSVVLPEECDAYFKVGQNIGDSCNYWNSCSKNLLCKFNDEPGVCSTCQPAKKLNELCESMTDCQEGFYCGSNNDNESSCLALLPDGEKCDYSGMCASGWCRTATAKCTHSLQKGDWCNQDDECAGLLGCVKGKCADRLVIGDECKVNAECVFDAICDAGKCKAIDMCSKPAIGERCIKQCADGAYCQKYDGDNFIAEPVCQSIKRVNARCEPNADNINMACGDTAFCSYDSKTCLKRIKNGETCNDSEQCLKNSFCDKSKSPWVCRGIADIGEDCANRDECKSYNCDPLLNICIDYGECTMP